MTNAIEVKTITILMNKSKELIKDGEVASDAMAPAGEMIAERMARAIDFSFMAILAERNPPGSSVTDSCRPVFTCGLPMC